MPRKKGVTNAHIKTKASETRKQFRDVVNTLQELATTLRIPIIKIEGEDGCQELGKCLCQILAKQQVLFLRLCNLQIELSELRTILDKLIAGIVEVHEEPTKLGEVQAVLRDFLNKSQSQNNRKST